MLIFLKVVIAFFFSSSVSVYDKKIHNDVVLYAVPTLEKYCNSVIVVTLFEKAEQCFTLQSLHAV